MRIAKFISNSGYCSRREAEKLILKRKVVINNQICEHPSEKVIKGDMVKINNKIIQTNNKIELWMLNKPIKYICSNKDNFKRKKIFDLLPNKLKQLKSIGRLDYMSEGLILLTNDGDYSRFMELPSSSIKRTYRICINGGIKENDLKKINNGLTINKIRYNKVKVVFEKNIKNYTWLIFKLREGKNREIRNICKFFNWKIVKLIRIGYGSYKLGNLNPGEIKKINIIKYD